MKITELVTKAGFYFFLPFIVVLNDSLGEMDTWEWNIQSLRGIVIVPLIAGLTALKAYFSSTYSNYKAVEGKDAKA